LQNIEDEDNEEQHHETTRVVSDSVPILLTSV